MRRIRDDSATKAESARCLACTPLLSEVGGPKSLRQSLSGLGEDGLIPRNMAGGEAIERCRDKQRAHEAADLVENGHGQTSGAFNIFGERQIHPGSPGLVDPFHQLIAVEYRSGRDLPEIGSPEKSLAPVGGLKCHEHDAEGTVQRDLPGKWLDDLRSLRTKAPVHDDGLASLQDGKAAIFACGLGENFEVRVNDLQQPSERVERGGERKKPRAQSIFAIFEPLKNSIFDERAGNAGDRWDREPDPLAYVGH